MLSFIIEVVSLANENNLKPVRSKSEARERGKKGGQKSAKVRREKKLLKDCMLDLLNLDVSNQKQWNKLSKMGIDPNDINNRTLLTVALFQKAVEAGDVNAFKEICNLIGESTNEEDAALNKLDEVLEMIKGNI